MSKRDIVAKDFYIGAVAMSLDEFGQKLGKKRDALQDLIASTDDISVRMKTALKVDKLFKQLSTITAIVDCLEKRNSKRLLEYKDDIENLYLQIKDEFPDYVGDLEYVKNCFIYDSIMKDLMQNNCICVSFEDAESSLELAQEACVCAVKEIMFNKRVMEKEGKTEQLVQKEKELQIILNYFINLP